MSLFSTAINNLDGTPANLSNFDGQVVLVVNVASKCGLTPQYTGLEEMQKHYAGRGFTVLGVPCNQFMEQEPGSADEIQTFCSTTYGVTFPLLEKVDVNGENQHPLYAELTKSTDAEGHTGEVRWNFEKFLIGRDGSITRFGPLVTPEDPALVAAIDAAL